MLQRYLISPRCRRGPPLHTTMASDVNITPTSSIVHNLSEMVVGQSLALKSGNTHLINFSLSYLWAATSPHPRCCLICISISYLLIIQYPSSSCGTIYCNEHPQPIQDLHFVLLSWSWSDQYILQLPWTLRSFSCHAVRFTPSKYGN